VFEEERIQRERNKELKKKQVSTIDMFCRFFNFDVHLECHWFSLNVNFCASELCLSVIYEVKRTVTKLWSMTPFSVIFLDVTVRLLASLKCCCCCKNLVLVIPAVLC